MDTSQKEHILYHSIYMNFQNEQMQISGFLVPEKFRGTKVHEENFR